MRSWQIFVLILILAFFAVSSAWRVLYVLTYVLLILFALSWLWTRLSLRGLSFRRMATSGRVQVGETFDERLLLDNAGRLPKLWVQIVDGSTLPAHRAGYVASIGGRKRAVWRARSVCRLRGRFQLGPVSAMSGDPFGFFRRRILLAPAQEILVLPRVYTLTSFFLFSGGLPGRGKSSLRALQTTTNATTIREYVYGDALSRIHWRSSAHFNKLMVREFDLDPSVDAWIFLDLHEAVQAGEGQASTTEYGVTIAASVALHLLHLDLSVGLLINGEKRDVLSLDRGDRQAERVLESLALANIGKETELREALTLDAFRLSRNTVVIVITPSLARDWHESVRLLQRRSVQVAVIGLDAASFIGQPANEDTLAFLEGSGIPVLRIKCGDPIAQILQGGTDVRFSSRR